MRCGRLHSSPIKPERYNKTVLLLGPVRGTCLYCVERFLKLLLSEVERFTSLIVGSNTPKLGIRSNYPLIVLTTAEEKYRKKIICEW